MAYNTRPSAPGRLCTDLLQRLQIAILEHVTGSEFRIIGHPPSWLFTLYPDARDTLQLSVDARTLQCFKISWPTQPMHGRKTATTSRTRGFGASSRRPRNPGTFMPWHCDWVPAVSC
jgi:hypothetical protein